MTSDFMAIDYLSVPVFCIAVVGIALNLSNIIRVFLCIELMFLAVGLNLIYTAYRLGDINGQVFTLFVLTVAAAESAIGLAILVYYFRVKANVSADQSKILKD